MKTNKDSFDVQTEGVANHPFLSGLPREEIIAAVKGAVETKPPSSSPNAKNREMVRQLKLLVDEIGPKVEENNSSGDGQDDFLKEKKFIDSLFRDYLGRNPSEKEFAQFLTLKRRFRIESEDPIWAILFTLENYNFIFESEVNRIEFLKSQIEGLAVQISKKSESIQASISVLPDDLYKKSPPIIRFMANTGFLQWFMTIFSVGCALTSLFYFSSDAAEYHKIKMCVESGSRLMFSINSEKKLTTICQVPK